MSLNNRSHFVSKYDEQMLATIESILTKCNYPKDLQIYFIAVELAQLGYVTLTQKTWDIHNRDVMPKQNDGE